MAPVVEARSVTRILPETVPVTLVHDIDLRVERGEFLSVTGPSGSGKSSLLYLLGLLDVPTAGEVLVDGVETARLTQNERAQLRLEKLGFVFQFHFLLPEFTALMNVALPILRLGRLSRVDAEAHAQHLLEQLDMGDQSHKRPDQLSGGQRQRVAVARALANDPVLILADEPTGNLDSRNSAIVQGIFERLASEEGRTIVAVTHDLDFAAAAGRNVHLVDGAIATDKAQPHPRNEAGQRGSAQ